MPKEKKEVLKTDNMKVIIDVIHGDRKQNDFMHYCDVFENSKQLGKYESFVVEGEPDLENLTINIKKSLEAAGESVVFVSIRQVGPTLTNDYERYIMPGVSTISNGHKWGMFHKMLKDLGYEAETNQYMRVEKVKLVY